MSARELLLVICQVSVTVYTTVLERKKRTTTYMYMYMYMYMYSRTVSYVHTVARRDGDAERNTLCEQSGQIPAEASGQLTDVARFP